MEVGEQSSDLGQWRTAHRGADPRLRAHVHGFFASASRLNKPVRELHLPSTEVALLLNFAAPHRRLRGDGGWMQHDGAWVVGLHDRLQITEAAGERRFMVVRFTPVGAHLFLRLPMHTIANQALDLDQIDPALARAVKDRVGAARNWQDRFAAMEALIVERIAEAEKADAIGAAWRSLEASEGRIAIGSLASQINCSRRSFIDGFRTQIGFAPKTMARLLRFNRATRALDALCRSAPGEPASKPYIECDLPEQRRAGAIPWADLAADCGYFDQAHLIKDFQDFAGSAPAALVRRLSSAN